MRRNVIETVMGGVVIIVAVVFVVLAFQSSGLRTSSGYDLKADFNDVSGISTGTDVRMSGVKIGTVVSQALDPKTFQASVIMNIDDGIDLPTDTSARILPESLLGGNFIALEPGADEENLKPGGRIQYTQGSINLLDTVVRLVTSSGEQGGGAK